METLEAVREKRLSPRVALDCPIRYRAFPALETSFRKALVKNVSLTGFRFRSSQMLARRTGFIVEMSPPGMKTIRSLARAAWVRELPAGGGYEVGGMFVEPNSATVKTLAHLLSGH